MAEEKSFTYSDVAEHAAKKDLHVVIHDLVYNITSFVDEHPGGEEVLLDVGGMDATEAFEDVGHSDEAREILDGLLVGKLKRQPGDPKPKVANPAGVSTPGAAAQSASSGTSMIFFLLFSGLVAMGVYFYLGLENQG
ncbi:cytochrome b5 [Eremomyces bilateralis CBS 781.70]|uniref:Cytochrome b5 n=1 Tax=Eremomyces bilateralis CBS 781.70 TaxID=1392243 RepID=A0A6G1FVH9_9PEZI|nr:cytochrome b5 [Eremomyces bilateralis CBS 781.70]KAF1809718.1 cytochrome b5 [Eremomyces bilateralis CBS 781.70]